VYSNIDTHRGIAFSINTDHSIAQNNYVHDQDICMGINRFSNYDVIYNNTLLNCNTAIDLTDTSKNIVHDNKIVEAKYGIVLQNVTNKIFNNKIHNSTNGIVLIHTPNTNSTILAQYIPAF
jgi:parallel beta-helix repeat protein